VELIAPKQTNTEFSCL